MSNKIFLSRRKIGEGVFIDVLGYKIEITLQDIKNKEALILFGAPIDLKITRHKQGVEEVKVSSEPT